MFNRIFRLLTIVILSCWISASFANATRYIIDTDMGFDDWLAVLYLLKQPVEVDAITIDCVGETRCPAGAVNASRLTHLAKRDVPIASGNSRPLSPYNFPAPIRDYASNMAVPGFLHIKKDHDLVSLSAAQLIFNDIISAAKQGKKVAIISIGTATNINDAWKIAVLTHQTSLFRQGLEMIYKGGGAFGRMTNGHLTNDDMPGNISIPGVSKSNNTEAEWNIYANAQAMNDLVTANLPITFVPNNATDQVPMSNNNYNLFVSGGKNDILKKFTANALESLYVFQNSWEKLDYWDTATTLAALHPEIVSTKLTQVPITIDLKPGMQYAAIKVSEKSDHRVNVYYHLDKNAFYQKLLSEM